MIRCTSPLLVPRTVRVACAVLLAAAAGAAARAQTAADAYRAMGIATKDVLSGTCLTGRVVPDTERQLTCVTTYLTGARDDARAVNVRLDVFDATGGELRRIYGRDYSVEGQGPVAEGNLLLFDLDMDEINEIVASYRSFADPLIERVVGEVIVHDESGFRVAWNGALRYDATRAAREVPAERRDRFRREIDYRETLRTRGGAIYFDKHMLAVAGESLAEPRVVRETFPLRASRGD